MADLDVVTQLVKRSLDDEDLKRILATLGGEQRDLLIAALSKLLRNTTARLLEEVQKVRSEEGHLLDLTGAMSTELQLQPLLVRIMQTVTSLLEADRATLFMHDRASDELWALVGQGEGLGEIRFPASAGIAGHVLRTAETISIPDAYSDPRFNPELDRKTGYRTRSMLCMPVLGRAGEPVAVTQVLNKKGGPFTAIDERRLRAFSAQASIALDRAQLFEAFLEKQRIEQSLSLAHDIQMAMLPRTFPERPEFELHAELRPARSVGGDLYDFFEAEGRLFFLVGDVSGKGVGAALFMAVTKTLFRASVQAGVPLAEVMRRVNHELCRDNERAMFVTAFAGCLETRSGELAFVNAGHHLPYRLAADGSLTCVEGVSGLPLAVFADYQYPSGSLRLRSGEALFLYTDGITEALGAGEQQFSAARLEAYLQRAGRAPARDLARGALAAVEAFAKGEPQFDDLTVMALRYTGPGSAGR